MAERLILTLSGGGALGAYECGVYRAVVKEFGIEVVRSMVLVGASSGALNAAVIARHSGDPDGGVAALERFWRELSVPSLPFFPYPHSKFRRLNATLTGLLCGNPAVFYRVPGGLLGALLAYPVVAPYRNDPLLATLDRWVGTYRADAEGPRLLVRAVDITGAVPVWFDSTSEPITSEVLAGSTSIPLLFSPRWHDGMALWDGDVWTRGLVPEALRRLTGEEDGGSYHTVSVELVAPHPGFPVGIGASLLHVRDMQLGNRFDYDERDIPADARNLKVTRIRRPRHPDETFSSSLFDWGQDHIEALMDQGERDAEQAFSKDFRRNGHLSSRAFPEPMRRSA